MRVTLSAEVPDDRVNYLIHASIMASIAGGGTVFRLENVRLVEPTPHKTMFAVCDGDQVFITTLRLGAQDPHDQTQKDTEVDVAMIFPHREEAMDAVLGMQTASPRQGNYDRPDRLVVRKIETELGSVVARVKVGVEVIAVDNR